MTTRPTTALEMIERLVAFDTVSSKSNLALIDFVAQSLENHGVASRRSFDAEGGKANLFATLGPDIAGGIVLEVHRPRPVGRKRREILLDALELAETFLVGHAVISSSRPTSSEKSSPGVPTRRR